MPVDNEIELVIIERQLAIVADFADLDAQGFQSLACNGDIRAVAFGGAGQWGQWLQAGEEFSAARPHVEQGLRFAQAWKELAGVAPWQQSLGHATSGGDRGEIPAAKRLLRLCDEEVEEFLIAHYLLLSDAPLADC